MLDAATGRFAAHVVTPRGRAVSGEFLFDAAPRLSAVAPLIERRPWGIDVPHVYTHGRYGMFHGPVFQSIAAFDGWDDSTLDVIEAASRDNSLHDLFQANYASGEEVGYRSTR